MNEFLAEIYNTRETIGAPSSAMDNDIQKLAEAQLLDQALQAEGVDIDRLSPDAILKVAYQLFGEGSHLVKAASEAFEGSETPEEEKKEEEEEEKEEEGETKESFETKVAQADFLGRVMAHSFVNEQDTITKEALSAGQAAQAVKNWGQRGAKAVSGAASSAGKAVKNAPSSVLKGLERLGKGTAELAGGKGSAGRMNPLTAKLLGGGVVTTGAAGIGSAGLGAKKLFGKKKEGSALDILAEQRAMDILKEAGVTSQEDLLTEAVEKRAWEMLQENGYTE